MENHFIWKNCETKVNKLEVLGFNYSTSFWFLHSQHSNHFCISREWFGSDSTIIKVTFLTIMKQNNSIKTAMNYFWNGIFVCLVSAASVWVTGMRLLNWNAELQTKKRKRCCLRTFISFFPPIESLCYKGRHHQQAVFSLLNSGWEKKCN